MAGHTWPDYFQIFDAGNCYVRGFLKEESELEDLLELHRRITFCTFILKNHRENNLKRYISSSRALPTVQHLHQINGTDLRICKYAGTGKRNIKSENLFNNRDWASFRKNQLLACKKKKSGKVSCPANIVVKYITVFTDYPVMCDMTRRAIGNLIQDLKEQVENFNHSLNKEKLIYVKLPLLDAHNHKLNEKSLSKGILHPKITQKMYQLVSSGITNHHEIKNLLEGFVYTDIFREGSSFPKEYDNKYFPTVDTVRRKVQYILKKLVRQGKLTQPDAHMSKAKRKEKKLKRLSKDKLIPITFEIDEEDDFDFDNPVKQVKILDSLKIEEHDEIDDTKDNVVLIVDSKDRKYKNTIEDVLEPIAFRKLFISGLDFSSTNESLNDYFTQWGEVEEAVILRDQQTNKSRRIGYITFPRSDIVDKIQKSRPHQFDGKFIDTRRVVANNNNCEGFTVNISENRHTKVYVSGLSEYLKFAEIQDYFATYGNVINTRFSSTNSQSRKTSVIVEYDDYDAVDKILLREHTINGCPIHIEKIDEAEIVKQEQVLLPIKDCIGGTSLDDEDDSSDLDDDYLEENNVELFETLAEEPINFTPESPQLLILESFYGGNHKTLVDSLKDDPVVLTEYQAAIFSLPNSNWHCRARSSALYFAQKVPCLPTLKTVFASSTLNLCELIGLRIDFSHLRKILYFHDHQLSYPVSTNKLGRDFQFGYNQILSSLAADIVIFSSRYTLQSFLQEIPRFINLLPDNRLDAKAVCRTIQEKSEMIYCPVNLNVILNDKTEFLEPLHLLWSDDWLKEKDPDTFFDVISELALDKHTFYISVIGNSFSNTPPIFQLAKERFKSYIIYWGPVESKERYEKILSRVDVIISTSLQDFSATSVLEAIGSGCYAMCPNRLVYPEFFPKSCLYNTPQQLKKILSKWCNSPHIVRNKKININIQAFSWDVLCLDYYQIFGI